MATIGTSIPLTIEQLKTRATISPWPDCGEFLNLSKNSVYAGIHAGSIPAVKIGSRYLVLVAPLLNMLQIAP